jgi:hypothetical protein
LPTESFVRRIVLVTGPLLLTVSLGCRILERGPSDEDVLVAVRNAPPAPPTVGPTYLADIDSVQVEERGRYNAESAYWPVRVRVKGRVKVKVTNIFQLGLLGDRAKDKAEPMDFVEEARFAKDDFDHWRATYHYAAEGPRWRLNEPERSPGPK